MSEYSATPGGALKLKGSGSKISKPVHNRKKKKRKVRAQQQQQQLLQPAEEDTRKESCGVAMEDEAEDEENNENEEEEGGGGGGEEEEAEVESWGVGKTEAERRHEERRRKTLDERLKREGIKTHKERVEELNRYLSNLSEHHDMPRIGPG